MKRAELEAMALEELYRFAEARGIREAAGLPREVLVSRLADDHPPAPEHHRATHGRGESAREHSRERDRADRADRHDPGDSHRAAGPLPAPASAAPATATTAAPGAGTPSTRGNRRYPAGIPSSVAPDRPQEHDTESMARIYLEQGEADRAAELYRELLRLRPDDAALLAGLSAAERLLGTGGAEGAPVAAADPPPATPATPPAPGEPMGMLDLEEPPDAYGLDECELLFKDPHYLFVYWEVTDGGLAAARRHLGDEANAARLVVRVFSQNDRERGPERESRDHHLDWNHGRRYFSSPRPGARVRAAVGLVTPTGLFAPIAHSSQVRVPPAEPSPHAATEWMNVTPAKTRGLEREPVAQPSRGGPTGERTIAGGAPGTTSAPPLPLPGATTGRGGSSEQVGRSGPGGPNESSPSSPWRWRPGSQS